MSRAKRKVEVVKKRRPRVAFVQEEFAAAEVVKVPLTPHKILQIEAPRDCIPVVAAHPERGVVEVVALPKKKNRTFVQWILGEYP